MSGGLAQCLNINECEVNSQICGDSLVQICSDTHGGYECSCANGFIGETVQNGQASCENINECSARNQGVCSGADGNQICIDNEGGFTCVCGNGFSGSATDNSPAICSDINECDIDPCVSEAIEISFLACVVGIKMYF